ncbi:hypothetical protein [Paraburkholderia acidiphila]|uniref:Uncharacterized protein n=1 Tax=Paraburkholderia acidiphila TaxID=2571747 RepID=A0A7Z2G7L9_9BURK|nr:hypothetical protein [Paraburkholderia acidiphila]QGZ56703.1 hypothetical protein FAZ97_17205 [Paraburkholderia acidiphila]
MDAKELNRADIEHLRADAQRCVAEGAYWMSITERPETLFELAKLALAALPSDAAQAPQAVPDMVWLKEDSEQFAHSIDEAVDDYVNANWPVPSQGGEIEFEAAFRLPDVKVRVWCTERVNDDDPGYGWEIIDAAPVAPAAAAPLELTPQQVNSIAGAHAHYITPEAWSFKKTEMPALARAFRAASGAPAAAARPTWRPEGDPMTWTAGPHAFASQPDARAAFEAWAKPRSYDLTRCSPAPYAAYKSDFTNGALAGWFGASGQPPLSTETVDKPVQSPVDSERYRWLRRQAVAVRNYASGNPNWEIDYALRGESFDAAVDAARNGASDDN